MPNYPNQELKWNDGEHVTSVDLNAMQRFAKYRELDMLIGAKARTFAEWDATYTSGRLHCFGGGAVRTSATAMTVTNDAGVIMCDDTSIVNDGSDNRLLAYQLAAGELLTTIAAPPASPNNRIDLICVKLDYVDTDVADQETRKVKDQTTLIVTDQSIVKRRKVRLQKQVITGTPVTGTAPVEPTVPAGYRRWASVYVANAQSNAAPLPALQLRDHRYPTGLIRTISWPALNAGGFVSQGGAGWTFDSTQQLLVSAGVSNIVRVFPQSPGRHNARLIGVGCVGDLSGCTVTLKRRYHDIGNTSSDWETAAGVGLNYNAARVISEFNSSVAQYNYHQVPDDSPIWANGMAAGVAVARASLAVPDTGEMCTAALVISSSAAAKTIKFIEWFWASC
jgi:hypothetical protein